MMTIEELFALPNYTKETIASKTLEHNGLRVTAEIYIERDESGEIVNGSCCAHYNGIYHPAPTYYDAIRIAEAIIDAWKQGKDYEGGN